MKPENPGTINEKLSALYQKYTDEFLAEYKNRYTTDTCPPDRINEFGIINEERFDPGRRILFVMKETRGWRNEDFDNGVLFRTWVKDLSEGKPNAKDHPKLWYNLGRWILLMQNHELDLSDLAKEKRTVLKALGTVAITNLNKVRGGSSSEGPFWKIAFSEVAGKVLREEVALIDPHVIVCCGTWDPVRYHLKDFQGTMLRMPHPSNRQNTVAMLEELRRQLKS